MTDHSEHSERAEIEHRDPATTTVLQRIIVPDHAPDFWDELTLGLAEDEAVTDIRQRRFEKRNTHRILLAAAVILILLVGSAVFAALPETGGNQAIDAGPTADRDTGPEPDIAPAPDGESTPPPDSGTRASLERTTVELATVDSMSTASGSDAEWFFGDDLMWTGAEFVTGWGQAADGRDAGYWISPDGVEWDRQDGPSPVLLDPFVCPSGYRCDVSPAVDPIPYHYAETRYEVMARTADTVLLRASVFYTIDGQNPATEGQELGPGPELHPDLLAAAAATDPCFAEVPAQDGSRGGSENAYISEWGTGGLDDPVIRLTCRQGATIAASFTLDLRDQLTAEQLEKVYSFGLDSELWVERSGFPAIRVVDAPSASYWADGVSGGVVAQQVADIRSSGDRFWTVSGATVLTSTDGVGWTAVDVPTDGLSGPLEPTRVEASSGGHILVRLSTDRRDWNDDRWFSVSHDDGASWSTPFEVPAELGSLSYQTDVGPAGVAVIASSVDDSEPRNNLSLVGDDAVRFTVELPIDSCCEWVAVGRDRVLLRTDRTLDVYQLDGTLIHRTMWTGDIGGWNSRWLTLPSILVVLMIAAFVIGFAGARARRTLSSYWSTASRGGSDVT